MMGQTPMVAFTAASVALLPLLGIGLAFLVGLVVRRRYRPAPQADDPTCGKCGYIVRGISSLTCPECGSDLREVGIIPPGTRRPMSPFGLCAVWSLILLLPSVILSNLFLDTLAPMIHTRTASGKISSLNGRFSATIDAQMKGSVVCWGGRRSISSIPLQTLELSYSSTPGRPPLLSIDLSTKVWTLTDANNKTTSKPDFDDQAIIALLAANGYDASDSRIAVLAAKVMVEVREMMGSVTPSGVLSVRSVTPSGALSPAASIWFAGSPPQPLPGTYAVLVAFWLLVWLLGIWWIARSFRRKVLAHTDKQAAAAG